MTAITGRFAEARLYLTYCAALLHPGRTMPTFTEPAAASVDLDTDTDDELTCSLRKAAVNSTVKWLTWNVSATGPASSPPSLSH
ncbi:hypothetical protein F3K40_43170 [Streptomyces sp. LBUM 1478]|nr:hypothetical protein [Streptomyces sp. LBUM 1478]